MGIEVAVFEREDRFLKTLADYMNERYSSYFEVFAFDDADRFLQFAHRQECRLCFAGQGILTEAQVQELSGQVDRLHYFVRAREEEGIYLFQSVEAVGRELFAVYMEAFPQESSGVHAAGRCKRMRTIGFYSPARPILQSCLALTMGQLLAKGQRVLYINFEACSGFEYLMQKHFAQDFSDLLFYMKEDVSRLLHRIRGIVHQVGNLYYIPPVFAYPDLEGIDAGTWRQFLETVMMQTEYDTVILDLTEQIPGLLDLLLLCDEIYTCHDKNRLAEAKIQQYESMLSYMQKEEIIHRTIKRRLPAFQDIPGPAALFTHSEMGRFVEQMLQDREEKKKEREQNDAGAAESGKTGYSGESALADEPFHGAVG